MIYNTSFINTAFYIAMLYIFNAAIFYLIYTHMDEGESNENLKYFFFFFIIYWAKVAYNCIIFYLRDTL